MVRRYPLLKTYTLQEHQGLVESTNQKNNAIEGQNSATETQNMDEDEVESAQPGVELQAAADFSSTVPDASVKQLFTPSTKKILDDIAAENSPTESTIDRATCAKRNICFEDDTEDQPVADAGEIGTDVDAAEALGNPSKKNMEINCICTILQLAKRFLNCYR